jgi:hypothetical protein
LQNQLDYVIDLCRKFDVLFENFTKDNDGFPSQLMAGQTCYGNLDQPVTALKPILTTILLSYETFNRSLAIEISNDDGLVGNPVQLNLDALQLKSDSLRQALLKLSSDLLQYKQVLDDTTTWLQDTITQLSAATDTSKMIPSLSILNAFRANATYFKAQFDSYIAAKISLYSLAKNVFDMSQYGSVLDCATSLSSSIDDSVFTKLTSFISSESTLVNQSYSSLLAKFANIQKYLGNSDKTIEYFLRNCTIWQKPIVNQQKVNVSMVVALFVVEMVISQISYVHLTWYAPREVVAPLGHPCSCVRLSQPQGLNVTFCCAFAEFHII